MKILKFFHFFKYFNKKSFFIFLIFPLFISSNPKGEKVISGDVNFERSQKDLKINQTSDKAIVEWKDFSIEKGEAVKFIQKNKSCSILNQVIGDLPSRIDGLLEGNGKIFLINEKGIFLSKDGKINTSQIILSTLKLPYSNFLEGKDLYQLFYYKLHLFPQSLIHILNSNNFLLVLMDI